jgi:hypothetical protein
LPGVLSQLTMPVKFGALARRGNELVPSLAAAACFWANVLAFSPLRA